MITLTRGSGRTALTLQAMQFGGDWLIIIEGTCAHIGAAALGAYDPVSGRSSPSVVTIPGHCEDLLVRELAKRISQETRKNSLVVAGIHLDDITPEEIEEILRNSQELGEELINNIKG